jgi:hypothetical protein
MWLLRFLLDTSGSTGTLQDNGKRLLDHVFDAAVDQVVNEVTAAALKEGIPLAVEFVGFSSKTTKGIVPEMLIAEEGGIQEAMNAAKVAIRTVPCTGMTHLRDSICESLAEMMEYGPTRGVLVVVTDGADTGSRANDAAVDEMSTAAAAANISLVPTVCADVTGITRASLQTASSATLPIPQFSRNASAGATDAMRSVSLAVRQAITGDDAADTWIEVAPSATTPLLRPPILQIPQWDRVRPSAPSAPGSRHIQFFPSEGE